MVATDLIEEVQRALVSDLADDPSRSAEGDPRRAAKTARRRRRWSRQAALTGVVIGALGGFLAVGLTIFTPRAEELDRDLVRWVGRRRSAIGDALARAVTFFGAVPGAAGVSVAAIALARRRPRIARQIAVGALGGVVAELIVKRFFRRPRPTLLEHLEVVGSTSFPSGHAMAAASLYVTLAFVGSRSARHRRLRAAILAGGGAVASAIGATRVYLGVHWPSDVLGGLALGTAWACGAEAAFDRTAAEEIEVALP